MGRSESLKWRRSRREDCICVKMGLYIGFWLFKSISNGLFRGYGSALCPCLRKRLLAQLGASGGYLALIAWAFVGRQKRINGLTQALRCSPRERGTLCLAQRPCQARQPLQAVGKAPLVPQVPSDGQALLIERACAGMVSLVIGQKRQVAQGI